jgi:hypothetical protein
MRLRVVSLGSGLRLRTDPPTLKAWPQDCVCGGGGTAVCVRVGGCTMV